MMHVPAALAPCRPPPAPAVLRNHGPICGPASPHPKPSPHTRTHTPAHLPPHPTGPPLQVRHELEQGHSVRYLLPDPVVQYIYSHGLYNTAAQRPRVLHWADRKVDRDQDA